MFSIRIARLECNSKNLVVGLQRTKLGRRKSDHAGATKRGKRCLTIRQGKAVTCSAACNLLCGHLGCWTKSPRVKLCPPGKFSARELDTEEHENVSRCVEAMVRDRHRVPKASLSISDSITDPSQPRLDELGPILVTAARQMNEEIRLYESSTGGAPTCNRHNNFSAERRRIGK